jgi:HEAT repeat protein
MSMARLGISLAALSLLWIAGCRQAQPPLAGGKPFDYWLREAASTDARKRAEAMSKLGNIGDADVRVYPALLVGAADPDHRVRCQAILALVKLPDPTGRSRSLLADIEQHDRDKRVRQYAAKALTMLSRP